jgi:hypothetical protein
MREANALRAVDDKRSRPSDVERRQPKSMIDPIAPDHRAIWIDEDRQREMTNAGIIGQLPGALADDNQHFGPERVILRQVGLQLLQLLAAVRSPGAANEHQYSRPTTEYVCEADFLAVSGLQREWGCRLANMKTSNFLGHLFSSAIDTQGTCTPLSLIIIRYRCCRRQHSSEHRRPVARCSGV